MKTKDFADGTFDFMEKSKNKVLVSRSSSNEPVLAQPVQFKKAVVVDDDGNVLKVTVDTDGKSLLPEKGEFLGKSTSLTVWLFESQEFQSCLYDATEKRWSFVRQSKAADGDENRLEYSGLDVANLNISAGQDLKDGESSSLIFGDGAAAVKLFAKLSDVEDEEGNRIPTLYIQYDGDKIARLDATLDA